MSAAPESSRPVLVVAATGKTGRRIATLLEDRGVEVRRGSRSGGTAGAGWVAFDWKDPATWEPAFTGIDAAYLTYTPDLMMPGALEDLAGAVEAAKRAGVRKLVLMSGRGLEPSLEGARIVRASGLAWTIVLPTWFSQNFTEGDFASMVTDGVIALPMGDVVEPLVDADDIAEVCAAALVDPVHDGRTYELTGPELLTHHEVAGTLSNVTGRAIRYEPISRDAFRGGLTEAGVPAVYIELLDTLFDLTLTGANANVTDHVEQALGRPARSFAEYARAAHEAGSLA